MYAIFKGNRLIRLENDPKDAIDRMLESEGTIIVSIKDLEHLALLINDNTSNDEVLNFEKLYEQLAPFSKAIENAQKKVMESVENAQKGVVESVKHITEEIQRIWK